MAIFAMFLSKQKAQTTKTHKYVHHDIHSKFVHINHFLTRKYHATSIQFVGMIKMDTREFGTVHYKAKLGNLPGAPCPHMQCNDCIYATKP